MNNTGVLEQENRIYERVELLTERENAFYKKLKPIAEKQNLIILSKIRLADLIKVKDDISGYNKSGYFSKIKSKHIDFALCKKDNLEVVLLIELDDTTHQQTKRKERDDFVDSVLRTTGYKLLRTCDTHNLEKAVIEAISTPTSIVYTKKKHKKLISKKDILRITRIIFSLGILALGVYLILGDFKNCNIEFVEKWHLYIGMALLAILSITVRA